MSRRAEDVIPGPRNFARPPVDEGRRVLVVAPRRTASVRVAAGRVIGCGTSPELQRLVGLSEAALAAWAADHGWRLAEVAP